ncbi:DUF6777 domain-containing protein [Streptomyces sp. NPDC028722]|uniref:DUF6777 domain-containing protein n=1 Tax=Streptomyces sp. NPDC028722 TaxID=3155016 RepID=UPI0033F8B56C
MRIPSRSIVTACLLPAALLAAGCAGTGVKQDRVGEAVFLQAATDRGPEPFTETGSGPTAPATGSGPTARTDPPAATTGPAPDRAGTTVPPPSAPSPHLSVPPPSPVPPPSGVPSGGQPWAPLPAAHSLSGATPGLYRGTPHAAGCDVERHIGSLAADRVRADAFAHAVGVPVSALPGYLRGLTPVALRRDTRVTSHAYRDRRAAGYQAVLQAGTAVLVDDRGMPRVRCACGNPLKAPAAAHDGVDARGATWPGYRPSRVIAVTPAPRAVTTLTIVDVDARVWIERRTGQDVGRDRVVSRPPPATVDPGPDPDRTGRAHTGPLPAGGPLPTGPAPTGPAPAGLPRTGPAPAAPPFSGRPGPPGSRPAAAPGPPDGGA